MKSARYSLLTALLIAALFLTGCTALNKIVGADSWKEWTPTSSAIIVAQDGSVTEIIMDTIDQSWYSSNELQDMIARSMNEYNAAHASDAIQVTEFNAAEGAVRVTIVYKTMADYAVYNNVPFFAGHMLDAEMQGFRFEGPFLKIEKGEAVSELPDASEPLSHKEYDVVILNGTYAVQVPGEIRYLSADGKMINSHTAERKPDSALGSVSGMQAETAAAEGPEEDPEEETDEETEKTYLYIIYEKDHEKA